MATAGGANIAVDGLVFGYDTGYPLVSGNSDAYKFNRGEPTTTFDVGDMTPSSPNTFFTSSASYDYNLHGTVWDWTFYPNSNPSAEGGMEWHPDIKGPGFKGAWLMKKRPGGNSESNFSGNTPGTIESTSAYTVSVWCKTDQASCFRIHINTTKNGSSYWGYASSQHSGGGDWERLSVTIPANEGNTSLNVIRCQALGTTITANAYFRNYQVEKNTHPTPFLLGGSRSVSGSLIDLTRTTDIDLSNVSFDSNAQMTFDGTDDYIDGPALSTVSSEWTVEVVFKPSSVTNYENILDCNYAYNGTTGNIGPRLEMSNSGLLEWIWSGDTGNNNNFYRSAVKGSGLSANNWHYAAISRTAANTIIGICDNEVTTGVTTSGTPSAGFVNEFTNLNLGRGFHLGGADRIFTGDIAYVKVYNRALSRAELESNYRAVKGRFNI